MKKLNLYIYALLVVLLTACKVDWLEEITAEQASLIGRAVNFNPSMASEFTTRAYSTNVDGSFNENDRMRIYRNYWDPETNNWSTDVAYRTYYRKVKRIAETINIGTDWDVESGRKGKGGKKGETGEFTQSAADTLTWENGQTLRFRAWSRSNYYNTLAGASRTNYYPDFCVADWVNASGPTQGIPLVLRHMGCRIWFSPRESGNEFNKIEISTDWHDYKRRDNADTLENDGSDTEAGKTDAQAQLECDSVVSVYNRMCIPAGVDMNTGYLKTVLNDSWNNFTDQQIRTLEEQPDSHFPTYGSLSASEIASQVKRPFFSLINSYTYAFMITIPYDMSNEATQGEVLVLPTCTRIRVYMRDINNGDGANTPGYEGTYHILSLSDIKKEDGTQAFPNGMELRAGYSYRLMVGYRYGQLTVTLNDNLSWTDQSTVTEEAVDEVVPLITDTAERYLWWKQAIADGIPTGTGDFNPVFHIKNQKEFLAFIELVNGTAPKRTDGLYRLVKTYKTTVIGGQTVTEPDTYGWSLRNSQYNPEWIEESEAEKLGYIFYDHYHAANADKAAYSDRDYLTGPYPFYDDNLGRAFTVVIDNDLDLYDWKLTAIGDNVANPFMGRLDGQGHTLSNLYMRDECLIGFMDGKGLGGASVTNLKIESYHPTCLVGTATRSIYLAGVAIHAPSTTNSLAHSINATYTSDAPASYVVGCIHVGDAGAALVGTASNLNMFGCMQAAKGIPSGRGALLGAYATGSPDFLKPQVRFSAKSTTAKPSFSRFMCNFYDTELSPGTNAVATVKDDYSLLEYIRGRRTDILCAKNDYLAGNKYTMAQILALSEENLINLYGLAPWHAMNYAIYWYNQNAARINSGINHRCSIHYELDAIGYHHTYPLFLSGTPDATYTEEVVKTWNPLEQTN